MREELIITEDPFFNHGTTTTSTTTTNQNVVVIPRLVFGAGIVAAIAAMALIVGLVGVLVAQSTNTTTMGTPSSTLETRDTMTMMDSEAMDRRRGDDDDGERRKLRMPADYLASCNGRGARFEPGQPCECWDCFKGYSCGITIPEQRCKLDAKEGQPYQFEEYWHANRDESAPIVLPIDYRVPYSLDFAEVWTESMENATTNQLAIKLNRIIRQVHAKFGNAETEGRYIVVGNGARSLMAAAVWAFSELYGHPVTKFSQAPYYPDYKKICDTHPGSCKWSTSMNLNTSATGGIYEIVTVPNNPDGVAREPVYGRDSPSWAYDLVYYWPHFVSTIEKKDAPLLFFSFTKMTGHASTRFGWAIIKDRLLAEKMVEWQYANIIHASADASRRALQVLEYINGPRGHHYFETMRTELQRRWSLLQEIFGDGTDATNKGFELKSVPNTAYAWIQCPASYNETQCTNTFASVGLVTWPGKDFGQTGAPYYERINLTLHTPNYTTMLAKLCRAFQLALADD